jgi:glycosyltransferase involved in cell wall biosynthesis
MRGAMIDNQIPLVTIAMPVYNGGIFLESAVRSIVEQSWKNWELLIIDDGSTDGAIDRLSFVSDERVIVLRDGKNKGLAVRLNEAILMANGKYLARMDHDDISHKERLMQQVIFLESHVDVDLLSTRCISISEDGNETGIWPFAQEHVEICKRPWVGFYMPHPSWMGRIQWFRRHLYMSPAPYCCEDQELLLRAHRVSKYHSIDDVLLLYRVREHTPLKKLWRTYWSLLKVQLGYFTQHRDFFYAWMSVCVAIARFINSFISIGLDELLKKSNVK